MCIQHLIDLDPDSVLQQMYLTLNYCYITSNGFSSLCVTHLQHNLYRQARSVGIASQKMKESISLAAIFLEKPGVWCTIQLLNFIWQETQETEKYGQCCKNCHSDHYNFLDFSVDLKKKKGIPRVAKMKYGAGFMHWCKRLHLISRNHKIFLEEKDKELSSARNSLLSAVQPT